MKSAKEWFYQLIQGKHGAMTAQTIEAIQRDAINAAVAIADKMEDELLNSDAPNCTYPASCLGACRNMIHELATNH